MGEATPLKPPGNLPYPITVTRLLVTDGQEVRRGDKLLEYKFMSATRRKEVEALRAQGRPVPPEKLSDDMVGSWECSVTGTILGWVAGVEVGVVIDRRMASKPLIKVEQPCTHPVQIHGMCGVCGADLTNADYLSAPKEDRAGPSDQPDSFELAHDALGVTVSTNEARRLETLSRDELLRSRRLSLIVDLDQTIIHTTVDPTVGEWMAEIEEDAREDQTEKVKSADGSTTPPTSPHKREKNPNARALQDVAAFQLADEVPPGHAKGKGRAPAPVRRWYFTKPRPGLTHFLNSLSELYEMHVYTMGTRTYADAICKVIDPDGKIFGGRILSRDESGSMSSKSLVRLFPYDQSMVAIIDDRSDVWGDCPNLVKVVPYDFFIGIGDINGAFLPPTQPAVGPIPNGQNWPPSPDTPSSASSSPPPETPPDIPSTEDGLLRQSKILDELAKKRPLAQLEEESERDESGTESNAATPDGTPSADGSAKADGEASGETARDGEVSHAPTPAPEQLPQPHRKPLLNPDDYELERVANILTEVHSEFYKAYDDRDPTSASMPLQCDTPLLIQEIKDKVLEGCVIAFTGVIPRNVQPERSEIWQLAESFGAICSNDLTDKVTHLVTATLGTEKMHQAAKMQSRTGIHIVWLPWLQSSIALWKREPEGAFLAQAKDEGAAPSRPESVDADGDDRMEGAVGEDGLTDEERRLKEREEAQDAADFDAAWDDDAQAEFDKFMEEDSDEETESGSKAGDGNGEREVDGNESDSSGSEDGARKVRAPSVWSRAATPGPSILSRAGSPDGSRASTPSPGEERHVRYADEENLPLEDVREPQPGDIPSFPPRKKPRLLVAPSADDDIPEANKMVYRPHGTQTVEVMPASQETETSQSSNASEDEDDEFAQLLRDSLADD